MRWSSWGRLDEEEGVGIAFRDVLFNGIGALLVVALVLFVLINPPTNEKEADPPPAGEIKIEIYWDNDLHADVDLWVKGPKGPPVGYSNKGGLHYNLHRDDLGKFPEDDPINYEFTSSRGIPAGPHCVNVHLFSNGSGELPVNVKVTAKIVKPDTQGVIKNSGGPDLVADVALEKVKQERNAFCFVTNESGDIESGDENFYQSDAICLRSPAGCAQ